MGELLRAICDATAIAAQTAFYTAVETEVVPNAGQRILSRRSAQIQCKTDTWFLMMGWTINSASYQTGFIANWLAKAHPEAFTVQDARTSESFSLTPVQKPLQGYTLNNIIWLPEFVLWPPSSVINVLMDVSTGATIGPLNQFNWVTLTGIEYHMPAGYAS